MKNDTDNNPGWIWRKCLRFFTALIMTNHLLFGEITINKKDLYIILYGMIKFLLIILFSTVVSSPKTTNTEVESEEIKPVEQTQTFSNSNNKPKTVENKQENTQEHELTLAEQDAYIQEMENLLNETDGWDMIIKDVENEGSDFKEIIFSDEFDMIESEY